MRPLLLIPLVLASPVDAQIRGEEAAQVAAERMLHHVGGRDAWSKARTFYVEERAFLPSGDVAELRIWRDLQGGDRRLERTAGNSRFSEWLSANGGFEVRDGSVRHLSKEELAQELQGLRQEPYAIYRRLARRDPAIRVQLRDDGGLYVYDGEERLLCWFLLDGKGAPRSWGNFWNGSINQHYYGPLADMGDANLPKWGVSTTGTFRFEYVRAVLDDRPVEPPARGTSAD
jgi:hypothetical protein